MSTVAGVFDETLLRALRAKADEIMFDDRIKQQYIPKIEVVNALGALQTAQVRPKFVQLKEADGRNKKYDVEVIWDNACELSCETNVDCDFCGPKLSTNAQLYPLDWERVVSFTVNEVDYQDNEFNVAEAVAKGLLKADKELAECFAQYAVAVLGANKGVNQMGTGSKGVVSGNDTYILPAYWDAKLVSYFVRAAQLNRFSDFGLISGSNLFEEYFTIQAMIANANGKGDANLFNQLRMWFDLFNIDSVNTPDLVTYMVSQGSVALVSKAFNPPSMEVLHTFTRWTAPNRFLPAGFTQDVFYEQTCDSDLVKHCFKVKLTADVLVNPEGCEANNTGILTFVCGAPV